MKHAALPPTLPPRLISRAAAAAYCSVSPNTFDMMIEAGQLPRPKRLSERRLAWDVRELDQAIDLLPHEGEATSADTSWDDFDAS